MPPSENRTPKPEAFRGFVEGVHNLQDYLRSNNGDRLATAEEFLNQSLVADPDFAPAQYYQAIVLTHARKPDAAIRLLEPLSQKSEPYRAEILYNLAFAYAKKYKYDLLKKSIETLGEAYTSAERQQRTDIVLLVQAMQAWTFAVFAGRDYKHPEDFEQRQRTFLPKAVETATSVLADSRLPSISSDSRLAVEVESHNAAGIAYMRMGQYSVLFEKSPEQYWKLAQSHYDSALDKHPRDVRVLDNISTLKLIQGCDSLAGNHDERAREFFECAKSTAQLAIAYNPHDRFRHYNQARACAFLGQWDEALSIAEKILEEPGEVAEQQVNGLKDAIQQRDISPIAELLRTRRRP
jgi:tetratricopeptide (TPR) repeat protein